jgi:hypothetical protein
MLLLLLSLSSIQGTVEYYMILICALLPCVSSWG